MKSINALFILIILCTITAGKCKQNDAKNTSKDSASWVMEVAGKQWFHLRESDKEGLTAYRDISFNFPPSRGGRPGFQINADGTFQSFQPGPVDRPVATDGTWKWLEEGKSIEVFLPTENYQLTYISLEDGLLFLKKSSNN